MNNFSAQYRTSLTNPHFVELGTFETVNDAKAALCHFVISDNTIPVRAVIRIQGVMTGRVFWVSSKR